MPAELVEVDAFEISWAEVVASEIVGAEDYSLAAVLWTMLPCYVPVGSNSEFDFVN